MDDNINDGIPGLPVAGYRKTISPEALALVNGFKATEERILRQLDALSQARSLREQMRMALDETDDGATIDPRWLAKGRTALEEAFMFINRAIFQPGRVSLPKDDTAEGRFHHYEGKEALNVVADVIVGEIAASEFVGEGKE